MWLVTERQGWGQRLPGHHLHEHLFRVLQSLEKRFVCYFKVFVRAIEGHRLDLLLGIDKRDEAAARAQDQFGLILEEHLDHLVCVPQKDCLLRTLPLFDVAKRLIALWSLRSILLGEAEFKWLELLIAVEVALEMLQEHNFLVYRFWIVEEVVRCDLLCHGLPILDWLLGSSPDLLDVVEVEQVGVGDDLC